MAVCFDHADSFELDHFDPNFNLIFWLKVNNDTIFEASILEQGLSQDLETGCLKLAIVKFLGVQNFKGDHNILIFQQNNN